MTQIAKDTDGGFLFKDLTREIIGAAFDVHNTFGCRLLQPET